MSDRQSPSTDTTSAPGPNSTKFNLFRSPTKSTMEALDVMDQSLDDLGETMPYWAQNELTPVIRDMQLQATKRDVVCDKIIQDPFRGTLSIPTRRLAASLNYDATHLSLRVKGISNQKRHGDSIPPPPYSLIPEQHTPLSDRSESSNVGENLARITPQAPSPKTKKNLLKDKLDRVKAKERPILRPQDMSITPFLQSLTQSQAIHPEPIPSSSHTPDSDCQAELPIPETTRNLEPSAEIPILVTIQNPQLEPLTPATITHWQRPVRSAVTLMVYNPDEEIERHHHRLSQFTHHAVAASTVADYSDSEDSTSQHAEHGSMLESEDVASDIVTSRNGQHAPGVQTRQRGIMLARIQRP
ncbi:hypothetical protein MIND_00153900 [Mycena indigotica]|uniref:Uncharacterized protein n=1 Tax=Mycena indigotica TaxID=2126181 RepID=A0A8H6WGW7_9AGAR|nr:uncharacterized protein MIND_00153900 [Mycena indigotica]KAF7316351.1 hypothetical protein MIND_00153900 [Mycena indigotica]